jgi:hypothetical protein
MADDIRPHGRADRAPADDHEASHRVVAALKQAGMLADPLRALIRAAGLRTVARPVKKIAGKTRCWRKCGTLKVECTRECCVTFAVSASWRRLC